MKTRHLSLFFFAASVFFYSFDARSQDATFDNVTVDKLLVTGARSSSVPPIEIEHTTTGQSFFVRSLNSTQGLFNGGIGFGSDSADYPLWVFETAKSETLSLREQGVGIGRYSSDAPLHVYADGNPFSEAHVLIENNLATADRTLLTLKNRGGSKIFIENATSQKSWVLQTTSADAFEIGLDGEDNGLFYVRGAIQVLSDKNAKENLKSIKGSEILQKVQRLPLYTFQFKNAQDDAYHLGPMAQDFSKLFNLGNSPKSISPMDGLGIALASIQGLNTKLEGKDQEIRSLRSELETLAKVVDDLKTKIKD